jgi:hypothetical protein
MSVRAVLILSLLGCAACKPRLLPGTTVEDTADNRRVVEFVAAYEQAIERRSADAVVSLCAPDYFEDNGTVDQKDDYGVDRLKAQLEEDFAKTKEIQLEILVQNVSEAEGAKEPLVYLDYRYKQRALVTLPAGDKWISTSDVNRLVLREDDEADDAASRFMIVSGL